MKKIILLCLFSTMSSIAYTQTIEMKSGFNGVYFYYNGSKYTMKKILPIVEPNTEAYQLMKKGKSNYVLASVIGGIGGALVGWPLGTSLGGGDPNWNLAYVGGGLIVVSIPISVGATKKMKNAVDVYNNGLSSGMIKAYDPDVQLVFNQNGLGLSMAF